MPTLATITPSFDVNVLSNGPFSVGGNLYQLCNAAHAPLQMFKSSDQGATWNVMDSMHAPVSSLNGVSFCFDGSQTLWTAYSNSVGLVAFIPFDTATDLYGAVTITANPASSNVMFVWYRIIDAKIVYAINIGLPDQAAAFIFDTVALTATSFQRVGTPGQLAFPIGAFQVAGLTYLAFTTTGSFPNSLFYQSIDGSGSIGSLVTVETGLGTVDSLGAVASSGSKVMLAWQADGITVSVWIAPISTLVFTNQILSSFVQVQTMAAVIQGGTVKLFVSDNDTHGDLFEVDDSGVGFGTPFVVIALGGFANVLTNLVSISPGIGIVVDTEPPVSYLFQSALAPVLKHLDAGGVQVSVLPSIGSVCKFARPTKPTKGPRVIQVGKQLTYPEWYVR